MTACDCGDLVVKILIDNGADVNYRDIVSDMLINDIFNEIYRCLVQNGKTPVMEACCHCPDLDIVKLLIHHGTHINIKDYVS